MTEIPGKNARAILPLLEEVVERDNIIERLRAELADAKRIIAEQTKRAVLAETALALKSAALNDVLMKL